MYCSFSNKKMYYQHAALLIHAALVHSSYRYQFDILKLSLIVHILLQIYLQLQLYNFGNICV